MAGKVTEFQIFEEYSIKGQLDKACNFYMIMLNLPKLQDTSNEEVRDSRATWHINWGHTLEMQNKFDAAMLAYKLALQENPGILLKIEAYNRWALALASLGRKEEAVEMFRIPINKWPMVHQVIPLHNLMVTLGELQRHEEMMGVYNDINAVASFGVSHLMMGKHHETLGNSKEALRCYKLTFGGIEIEGVKQFSGIEARKITEQGKLYRFCPFNKCTQEELVTQTLFLAETKTFNDPFDCNIALEKNPILKEALQFMRVRCFHGEGEADVKQNMLMWSHYANSHKGICIEYEHTPSTNTVKNCGLHKVEYKDEIDIESVHDYFKIKSTQWSYENEYRLCYYNDENTGGTVVKKCYKELGLKIKAIYAGVQFENREALELISNKLQCELRQMTREPYKFALNVGG